MENKLKILTWTFIVIILLVVSIVVVRIGGAEITEGKYMIRDYDAYPDAYIIVEGNNVQFFNIDLNAIYQQSQLNEYNSIIESGYQSDLTDEQIKQGSDLNAVFVTNGFEIDYEAYYSKDGAFTYIYYCLVCDNLFGLVLEYNSLNKTIQINSHVQNLVFDEEYDLYTGIVLVIMVVIGCILLVKIIDSIPDIWPSPSKYSLYDNEYNTYSIYNIRNEWLCEKDNLKSLQVEQIENIKACRIMFFIFIVGIIFIAWAPLILQLVGCVFLWIGIGSFWTSFINSSNKLAVYIAKTRGKRSIYLEIEECKRNIAELERIMDKKNINE